MKCKNQSASPKFSPVMICHTSGPVSYFEYYRGNVKHKLCGNKLIMLNAEGTRSIFCDVDK